MMYKRSELMKIGAVSLVLLFLISGFSYSIYQNQQKVMNERQELSVDNSRSWSAIMKRNQGMGSATDYISDYNNENSKIQNNISFNLGNVNSSYLGEIYVPVYLVGPYVFRNLVQVFSYDSSLLKFNGTLNDVASQNISFSYSSLAPDMLEVRGNGTFEATYSTNILYYLVFTPEITRQVKTSILLDYSIVGNSTYDTQAVSIINIARGWTNMGPFNISAPEVSTGGAGTVPAIGYSPYYPNILYVASGRGGPWQANLYQGADVNGFGGVYRSTDGGKTWKQVDLGLNSTAVESINVNPYNPYEVVISTSGLTTEVGGGIYKSINGGNSWQETFPQGGNYITYINGSLYAASFHAILYSTDFGSTWHVMASFSPIVTTLALDNNLSEIFVGLYYSDTVQIWRSSDGGNSFSEVANFPGYYTVSQIIIDPNNASQIWALVDHGYTTYPNLFRSMNGGLNWTTVNDTEVGIVYPIFSGSIAEAPQAIAYDPLNGSILYVVGPGYIYKSTDGGNHFEMIGNFDSPNTGQDNRMINVDPLNDSIIFVGSDQGLVVTYDGGKNWVDLNNRSSNMLYDVAADGPYIFTTAQDWEPLFSNDYGSTWYGTQDSEEGFVAVDPYNSSIVIHLPPFNNPLYVSNDGGASFFISDVNETALFVQPRDSPIPIAFGPNTIYIAGHNGIFYSNNSGKSFSLIPNSPGSLDPSASVLSSIVVSPSDPKILYAMEDIVTNNSFSTTLYRSDNFGFNWTVVNNVFPPSDYGVLSLAVDPFNPNTIYFASGYGHDTLYYSNNGGITYSIANISSSNMLVIPPAVYSYNVSGEELLVYVCNEGIFMSLNGGKTWMNENYNIVPSVVSSFFLSKNGSAYVSTYGSGVWYDPSLLNFTFKEYSPILTGFVPSGNYVYVDGSKYNISGYFSLALKSGINAIVYEPENEKIIINATNGSIYFINFSEIFPRLYNVTLTETGLPLGASWSITLNNMTKSSTNSTMVFNEPNGSYSYTIATVNKSYSPSPSSGTFTVNGSDVNISITFTLVTYTVTFAESGLPSGTMWYVNLSNGQSFSSTTNTITFNEPNGSYTYSISTINKEYALTQPTGSFKVNGANVNIAIPFYLVTYTITFKESGLPAGTLWFITLNGITHNSTTNTITFTEPNGSYSYTIETPISGGTGIQYVVSQSTGTLTVNGADININVPYTTQYYLTMIASPSNGGTVSPSSGWYDAGSSVTIDAISNSNFEFVSWSGTGNGSYSGTNNPASITINGPITETANFTELYKITFMETGLPPGTTWYVNLSNGQSYNTTGNSIEIQIPNGSYSYMIATTNKEYSAQGGPLIVNGANMEISIKFNLVTYAITFTESGLSSGTSWSVTLNNVEKSSTNGTIIFNEPNGTYSYTISGISGYRASSYSGTISVNGNSVSVPINWTIITYTITITENGIPNGTSWSATLTGTTFNGQYINVTLSSTTNTITFNEPNGTYSYIIHLPSGYQSNSVKGQVNVSGNSAIATIKAQQIIKPQQTTNYLSIGIIAVVIVIAIVIGAISLRRSKNKKGVKNWKEPPKQN